LEEAAAWRWVGDRALLRTYAGENVVEANRAALASYRALRERNFAEVEDLVPGARTLLVVLIPGAEPGAGLRAALDKDPKPGGGGGGAQHTIEVAYGGEDGPDLGDVARSHAATESEVIRAHSGAEYVVAFVGFSPGFAYLVGMPPALSTPRLDTPRTRVPAGSVGIGGPYTGIYPRATPGGWRLIGRTPAELFDPARDKPSLLEPGDTVRFAAVDARAP